MVGASARRDPMSESSIPIRNVYVMMAYAFGTIRDGGSAPAIGEDFEHLHELFAEILIRGVRAQVKRGLHHDYRSRRGELATVRGRIDVAATVSARSTTRGRLVCEFDEYESDTPHNRALKAALRLLARHGEVSQARRRELHRLLGSFGSVVSVAPATIRWADLTYHRANGSSRLLLGTCELVVRGLLPAEASDVSRVRLTSWLADDEMSRLYENFLLAYYRVHHPDLSPGAPYVSWDYDTASARGADQLPRMRTDVTLRNGAQTLIIDAKYYGSAMQVRYDKASVRSGHLYQVLAYAKNEDVMRDGSVSALLLYAQTDADVQPDLDVTVQGTRVGAQTLDLNAPWSALRAHLEHIATWLEPTPTPAPVPAQA